MGSLAQRGTTSQQMEGPVETGQPLLRKSLCFGVLLKKEKPSLPWPASIQALRSEELANQWGFPKGEGKAKSLLNDFFPFPGWRGRVWLPV